MTNKHQVTIPKHMRSAFKVGDLVEVVHKKVDVKKRLDQAEADYRNGRFLGPFTSATAAMRAVKRQARGGRSH